MSGLFLSFATTFTYDGRGQQNSQTDAEGVKTWYGYNNLSQLTSVTENFVQGGNATVDQNVLTQYVYDFLGNRLHLVDGRGITQNITSYDDFNRPLVVTNSLGHTTTTSYDALGNVRSVVDGNEEETTYEYDRVGRLKMVTYVSDGETVTYGYDALGNRTSMDDEHGLTTYVYNDLNRLTTVISPEGVVAYEYDAVGNRTKISGGGKATHYTYDKDGRLTAVQDETLGKPLVSYQYDPAGRLIGAEWAYFYTTYTYNGTGQLTQQAYYNKSTNAMLASFSYTLDKVGNRTASTESLPLVTMPGQQLVYITYDYDKLYRLTFAEYSYGLVPSYSYNHSYDAVGNMTAVNQTENGVATTETRTFNNLNQLTSSTKNGVVTNFGYDQNGNLTSEAAAGQPTKNYVYNQRNLMTRLDHHTTPKLSYVYDGNGDRVRETAYSGGVAGDPTIYLNDAVGLTQVFVITSEAGTDSEAQTVNRFGLDLVAQDKQGANRLYLATDGLGSGVTLTNARRSCTLLKISQI